MLYKNVSKFTYVFYDDSGKKYVVQPTTLVEDSLIPEVITMKSFIPYGMKRTPKLPPGGDTNGNR